MLECHQYGSSTSGNYERPCCSSAIDRCEIMELGPSTLKISIVGSWSSNDTIKKIVTDSFTWKTTIKTLKSDAAYTIQIFCEKDSFSISDIMIGET